MPLRKGMAALLYREMTIADVRPQKISVSIVERVKLQDLFFAL
jgi:hypothetical protein